jgi:hypothetical protein
VRAEGLFNENLNEPFGKEPHNFPEYGTVPQTNSLSVNELKNRGRIFLYSFNQKIYYRV